MSDPRTAELAPRDYWDDVHAAGPVPSFGQYRPERQLLEFMRSHLKPRPGQRLIELGAGNSAFLAPFARIFGYRPAGLDFSPLGVEMARRNLDGIDSDVREADLFDPPADWINAFDVVLTVGVVEHFPDTANVVRACARYLAPGGRMLTVIPNMRGLPGFLQRRVQHEVYDRHVPLTADQLAEAHQRAGLRVWCSRYLGSFHGGVVNEEGTGQLGHLAYRGLWKISRVLWGIENRTVGLSAGRWHSPWVVCVAQA